MNKNNALCQYQDPSNIRCPNKDEGNGCCFWHDESIDKSTPDIKNKLQQYAKNGGFLRGICLKKAQLQGIDLVNHHQKQGFDFSYADFYRADLTDAHLFNINLTAASLMKADLREANLNCATLTRTNMLGIKWTNSKIENVIFGSRLKQEYLAIQAQKRHDISLANDYFQQAEEIYRDLRKHAEREGIFTISGDFIQKELTMRRYQLPRFSIKRFTSKVVDLFCGYGEAPLRIVGISIGLILCCAVLYMFSGINYHGQHLVLTIHSSLSDAFTLFLSCLYYSVVTFTTLGYGDITPIGISRAIAAFEAFTGSFTIALFVVVFVKKMTR